MSRHPQVAIRDLSFSYDSDTPLIDALSAQLPRGFTGIVGANGSGKSTLLGLITGGLNPASGVIEGAANAIYCAQRTDDPPIALADFLSDWDGEAGRLRGRFTIEPHFLEHWSDLSHGERKRTQIACALWQQPDVLAIDEPTNHIDGATRNLLINALVGYSGVGIIVSHDRALLDILCIQTIWMAPPLASVYPAGYTQAFQLRRQETDSAIARHEKAAREKARLTREVNKRREQAARADRARSKRGLSSGDSDAREKINRARVTDGKSGNRLRQLAGRMTQAEEKLAAGVAAKTVDTGIWLPGARSQRNTVLDLPAGSMTLADNVQLSWPDLSIGPASRIAITGDNGSGKSSFIRHALPFINAPSERLIWLPQETTRGAARRLLDKARSLPGPQLGHLMNIVSRLGSRPERLLQSRLPSPGELRKLMLAMGMSNSPHVIIMDEPTNHLDLPSIEALQEALADCPCALVLVSHDDRFLQALATAQWRISTDDRAHHVLQPGR